MGSRVSNPKRGVMTLAIAVNESPPSEFRIFKAGENSTLKGTFLFDDEAARLVMAAYEAHGVLPMIDLEHLSLEDPEKSVNFDPDARGWVHIELRNGELWAVGVTWTPDGEARLREKRQRYISPAFTFDEETRRITALVNIAITALPATDHTPALVAASRRQTLAAYGESMTPEQFAALAEALGLGADANVEDVVATVAAMVKKLQDAANAEAAEPPNPADPADGAPAAMAADAEHMAASARLVRLSGKPTIGEAVREAEVWRASHIELEAERAKLAKERAALEAGERRKLVAELVKIGAEIPALAWAGDGATKPAEPWASMPIAQLRERVAKLSATRGRGQRSPLIPPTGDVELTEQELAKCKAKGVDPAKYAATKRAIVKEN
jgi:hypothetical protein